MGAAQGKGKVFFSEFGRQDLVGHSPGLRPLVSWGAGGGRGLEGLWGGGVGR